MKAIFCMFIPQSLAVVPVYGEFYWSPKHKCHVWGGQTKRPRELDMIEFNQLADKILHEYDFFGKRTVRFIEDDAKPAPVPLPPAPQLQGPVLTAATRPRVFRRRSQRPTQLLT